jgi:hypothetical protein
MYSAVLILHSWLRWAVLLLAVLVIWRAWTGLSGRRLWESADRRSLLLFTIAIDLQTLLGLVLYIGVSPVIALAFQNLGAAMRNGQIRFFVVEHAVGMLIAVALAHVGSVKIRKAADARAKHRLALTFVLLTLIVIVLSIPWPGLPAGRPLFRFSALQ